jgi:hypothetical protein
VADDMDFVIIAAIENGTKRRVSSRDELDMHRVLTRDDEVGGSNPEQSP